MTERDGGADFREVFPGLFLVAYRLALRILGNREDAEDVASEATARALVAWEQGPISSAEAWVARVATNLSLDQLRRRRRTAPPAVQAGTDPADGAVLRVALGAALAALPRRQREVIALRYLVDLQEVDVASALGISVHSVKKHASRGRASLRARLGLDREVNFALDG